MEIQKLTREKILEELHLCEFVEKFTREKCLQQEYLDDFIQEVWLIICQIPEERLIKLYNQDGSINGVRRFVAGIICRTVASQTSEAYYKLSKRDCRNLAIKMNNDRKIKWDEEKGWL